MLGYRKDSQTYRVFNLFHYKVVENFDVRFDDTNSSQRENLPNVLDEATPGEAIRLMGTEEITPTKEQAEDEIIISAPNQHEDNAQPEANAKDEHNSRSDQNLCPAHPRVANEV